MCSDHLRHHLETAYFPVSTPLAPCFTCQQTAPSFRRLRRPLHHPVPRLNSLRTLVSRSSDFPFTPHAQDTRNCSCPSPASTSVSSAKNSWAGPTPTPTSRST